MIRPPKPLKSFIYHTTAAYALERGITRGVPMGILRKLCHSTRWKAVFFILSVLICVVSTFFYAFSHPFFQSSDSVWNRLNQIQEEYPPGSSFTGAYRGATQCFGFAGYVFHALYGCDMPNSYYRVSAGWNGKPIRGRTAHPKKYKQNGLGTPAVPRPAWGYYSIRHAPLSPYHGVSSNNHRRFHGL